MLGVPAIESSPIDFDLIVRLLTEALGVFEVDREAAKRHIVQARTMASRALPIVRLGKDGLSSRSMRRVSDFVRGNLSTKLTLEQTARTLGISPGYLSRSFKAAAGLTYSEFVLRARVELAKRLLLTTDTPICEVAQACGLADQSHLTRVFKRSVGMPPGAWRRSRHSAIGTSVAAIDVLDASQLIPPHSNAQQKELQHV